MPWISNRFVKNYVTTFLIVCTVFISVFCISPLTLALTPDMERLGAPHAFAPMEGNILWDQSDNVSTSDIVSQDFIDGGGIFDIYDARAADDFLVPDGFLWSVETVKVFGTFDNALPDVVQSLDVVFFADEGGFPGEVVSKCDYKNVLPEDINDPSFIINLPRPCILTPGTYWMSVRANMLFLPDGQWFWNERTAQTLSPFVWENPGNGFGTGCITFSHAQADCDADFPDLTFQVIGVERPFPAVPTLGTLGLAVLSAALGLAGIIYYRKTRKQQIVRR
jgi:exosortase sorting signal-containing protein